MSAVNISFCVFREKMDNVKRIQILPLHCTEAGVPNFQRVYRIQACKRKRTMMMTFILFAGVTGLLRATECARLPPTFIVPRKNTRIESRFTEKTQHPHCPGAVVEPGPLT